MALRQRIVYRCAAVFSASVFLFILCFSPRVSLQSHAETEGEVKGITGIGWDYTDNVSVATRLDVVFSEFPVGSYFSYTGEPCTCHDKCSYYGGCDCISDYNDPEKGGKLVRLYSCQCMGFAHYMFYKLFGFVDRINYTESEGKYYSLGSLKASEMTVENVKKLFKDVKTGANVRAKGKHSFIVLSTDENGMYIYHANTGEPCKVDGWYWSWERFTERYRGCGIEYIHLPTEYPESTGTYVPPESIGGSSSVARQLGQVRVNTPSVTLRLRSGPSTDTEVLASIPHATLLTVTEISGDWGKVSYDEKQGWVSLAYTKPVLSVTVPNDRFYSYDGISPDMSQIRVALLQEDMTEAPVPPDSYKITYSSPQNGQYTATVTVEEHVVSFPVTLLPFGDLNADKRVTASDAALLAGAVAGKVSLSVRQTEGADLDGNGTVNRNDAVAIVSYLTGKTTQLKPKKEES